MHSASSLPIILPTTSASTPADDPSSLPIYAVIWTTTPWTLPANQAISVHPAFSYVLVKAVPKGGITPAIFVVAHSRLEAVKEKVFEGGTAEVVGRMIGKELAECTYSHPFRQDP